MSTDYFIKTLCEDIDNLNNDLKHLPQDFMARLAKLLPEFPEFVEVEISDEKDHISIEFHREEQNHGKRSTITGNMTVRFERNKICVKEWVEFCSPTGFRNLHGGGNARISMTKAVKMAFEFLNV